MTDGQRIRPISDVTTLSPHARTEGGSLDPAREHDACGVGFFAQPGGSRSRDVVQMALEALSRVADRGAASTDNSGDGAGLLTQIPLRLLHRESWRIGAGLTPGHPFAVGMLFLGLCLTLRQLVSTGGWESSGEILREGLLIVCWIALWRPVEIFLFDWWPIRRDQRLLGWIARQPVETRPRPARD